jgi:biopolymer transport protein ExbB
VFAIIQAAGWPIWPLLLCSVIMVTLIIERSVALREAKVIPPKLLQEAIQVSQSQLPAPDTINKLEHNSPLGKVLASGFRILATTHQPTREAIVDTMEDTGRQVAHGLEKYLPGLATIATAAPLLGLLGTVVGMIEIFGSQSPTGGTNPQQLAHGISVALYNTAFGLIIAIPAYVMHRYFRSKVDAMVLQLEASAKRFSDHLIRLAAKR